jgi:plastocyanin
MFEFRRASILLVAIALAMFGLAACGDDDEDSGDETTAAETTEATTGGGTGGGAASTLEVSSPEDGSLAFDQESLTATAGEVTVSYSNPSQTQHDVVIEDESGNEIGKTDLITASTAETTVTLEPGSFTFYCDVAGHREAGMEGTLTVK